MAEQIITEIGGLTVLVETARLPGSERLARVPNVAEVTAKAFERAQQTIAQLATSTVAAIDAFGQDGPRPDRVELSFGIKFSAEGKVIIAGVSSEATLTVTLEYHPTVGD